MVHTNNTKNEDVLKFSPYNKSHLLIQVHCIWLASNPGFPFRILSCSFGEKLEVKLRDKIRNGKPGFEVSIWLCTGMVVQAEI